MSLKSQIKQRPSILITNDDGIHAKGIRHLWNALKSFADLTVVAPSGEQSAVGLSTTLRHPLRIEKADWNCGHENIWSITGTPADCVKIGLNVILERRPDFIVSGINRGANLGRNVLYSGTVAAAIESIMQGIPAIAFSCQDYHVDPDYRSAENYIPTIVQYVMDHPLPEGTLLNVNFPEKSLGKYKGFKLASQGYDLWAENPDKRVHPAEGHAYYWLGSQLKRGKEVNDSDDKWIKEGYITAVPVHVGNLTDRDHLNEAKHRFEQSFPGVF